MTVHQEFHGDVGQVAAGDIYNGKLPPERLARSPDQLRECPRCSQATWVGDAHCWHCGFDIAAHDIYQARARWERDEEARRLRALKYCAVYFLVGFVLWRLGGSVDGEFGALLRTFGGILLLGAVLAFFLATTKGQPPI